ncbi:MAG: type II secretion system protein GspE [Armatimonadetes bacterium]|nr:type II secretion system protein GspE [Armatimonadota bacterium]
MNLTENGHVSPFETINLEGRRIDDAIVDLVPGEFARKNQVLPLENTNRKVVVAIGSIESLAALQDLEVLLQKPIEPVMADANQLKEKIDEVYLEKILSQLSGGQETETALADGEDVTDLADLTKMAGETAVVQMINLIFAQAVKDGASDIHIEAYEREVKVRYRVDGMLQEIMRPPKRMHAALISRIKILGEMNIAERRLPQDGRIKLTIASRQIDVRVSILPTVFGERAVMRILDKGTAMLGLEELGVAPDVLARFRKVISQPYGIILATGPTGAGKSTTLYASLQEIWSPTTNIITVEDPVEYQVPGISQMQVRANIGLTFASGLRSIVRQDPDVIMVGEIRDHETADIAIHASLTGHLVFSTLHTNDAPGAVTRLLDMGVEPFLVSSSLIGVIAQRLVRRNCPFCSEPTEPPPYELVEALGITPDELKTGTFKEGKGCPKCNNTGFKGRQGLYELFVIDEPLKKMIVDRRSSNELKSYAIQHQGLRTLLTDGKLNVLAGKTTAKEILRVVQREEL